MAKNENRKDPTRGAKSGEARRRPRDAAEELPEGAEESAEDEAARDVQRAFEQGITRLPPG